MAVFTLTAVSLLMVIEGAGGTNTCGFDPPGPCLCRRAFDDNSDFLAIDCSEKNLAVIPDLSSLRGHTLYEVDLTGNPITTIPNGTFMGLHFHSHRSGIYYQPKIRLVRNTLTQIDSDAFAGLTCDDMELLLYNSSMTTFPRDAVHKITNLTSLDLRDNRITSLPPRAFSSLKKLQTLQLNGNKITNLDKNTFAGIENNLEYLHMNSMGLTVFPSYAVEGMVQLGILELSGNNFGNITEPLFSGTNTRIRDNFSVYMDRCNITHISKEAFNVSGIRITHLGINDNNLTSVDFLDSICESSLAPDVTVVMMGNPLRCSCDLLGEFKRMPITAVVIGQCEGPRPYTSYTLHALAGSDTLQIMPEQCPHLFVNYDEFIYPQTSCDEPVSQASPNHCILNIMSALLLVITAMLISWNTHCFLRITKAGAGVTITRLKGSQQKAFGMLGYDWLML